MPDMKQTLLALEERFWNGDSAFYEANLADDSLMVFAAPLGVLEKDQTVASITESQRWKDVRFEDVRLVALTDAVSIIVYHAHAIREDDVELQTYASSVYSKRRSTWKLVLHQQTPEEPGK